MKRRDFCLGLAAASGVGAMLAATPRPAPTLIINMPNGRPPLQLSQYKGKVVAVEFLLTYCTHCQRASKTSEMIYREYGSKGFQVVAAAINPGGDVVAYANDHNLSFPVGTVSQEVCMSFLQIPMGARMLMPQVAFVDRSGQLVEQFSGDNPFFGENEEKNMRQMVENLLKPAVSAGAKKATASKQK